MKRTERVLRPTPRGPPFLALQVRLPTGQAMVSEIGR
jgi:hypothetical protein